MRRLSLTLCIRNSVKLLSSQCRARLWSVMRGTNHRPPFSGKEAFTSESFRRGLVSLLPNGYHRYCDENPILKQTIQRVLLKPRGDAIYCEQSAQTGCELASIVDMRSTILEPAKKARLRSPNEAVPLESQCT